MLINFLWLLINCPVVLLEKVIAYNQNDIPRHSILSHYPGMTDHTHIGSLIIKTEIIAWSGCLLVSKTQDADKGIFYRFLAQIEQL